jgi:Cu(I)/Ag(I) efflux system periplasmic protein CusF
LGNLTTPKSVQKLQTALHAKAKAEAGYRFYALYDKISREDILAHAYADRGWGCRGAARQSARPGRRGRGGQNPLHLGDPAEVGAADQEPRRTIADSLPARVSTGDFQEALRVIKVDRSAGKITIKHGPIPKFGMEGMTMVFRASEAAMLKSVKAGDKIRFAPDLVDGQFTVTKIEKTK